jgi:hypothetical protein
MIIPRNYPFLGLNSPSERRYARSPLPVIVPPVIWALGRHRDPSGNLQEQAPFGFDQSSVRNRPSGSNRIATARHYPSHGISAPTAHIESEVHLARVYLARYVPLTGFLNLLGFSSSRNLPALFHAGNAHGISPSGRFPRAETEFFRTALPS